MASNLTDDKLTYFQLPDYTLHLLPKDRQVASGILTRVKEGLTSHCEIIKSMGSMQDICEIIRLNVWKSQSHFKIYAVYNPPQNRPNFDLLNISYKTVVLGDFNAHSTRWGYKNRNTAWKAIEDIFNNSPLELIYSDEDPATYLHYNETRTTPDLFLVSNDICELTQRKIIDYPGSGHKLVIASSTSNSKFMTSKMPTKLSPSRGSIPTNKKVNLFVRNSFGDIRKQETKFDEIKEDAAIPHKVLTEPFSSHELNAAIKQLKCKKSPDDDCIHLEFPIRMGPKAKEILLTLFNKIWENSLVPTQLKVAIVTPKLKKEQRP
nr:hypothetical protein HmN_000148200 [Hymenolepis microstoma]